MPAFSLNGIKAEFPVMSARISAVDLGFPYFLAVL